MRRISRVIEKARGQLMEWGAARRPGRWPGFLGVSEAL